VIGLMDSWKIIGTAIQLGSVGPTPFAPSTRVPSCKHSTQKICRGGGGTAVPLGSAISPKISKTVFLCLVYLLMQW
jgi:hypothetical protein